MYKGIELITCLAYLIYPFMRKRYPNERDLERFAKWRVAEHTDFVEEEYLEKRRPTERFGVNLFNRITGSEYPDIFQIDWKSNWRRIVPGVLAPFEAPVWKSNQISHYTLSLTAWVLKPSDLTSVPNTTWRLVEQSILGVRTDANSARGVNLPKEDPCAASLKELSSSRIKKPSGSASSHEFLLFHQKWGMIWLIGAEYRLEELKLKPNHYHTYGRGLSSFAIAVDITNGRAGQTYFTFGFWPYDPTWGVKCFSNEDWEFWSPDFPRDLWEDQFQIMLYSITDVVTDDHVPSANEPAQESELVRET